MGPLVKRLVAFSFSALVFVCTSLLSIHDKINNVINQIKE
jgi:hypothetical protein